VTPDQPVHPEVGNADSGATWTDVPPATPAPALDVPPPVETPAPATPAPAPAPLPTSDGEAAFDARLSALVDERLRQLAAGAPLAEPAAPPKPRPHIEVGQVVAFEHTDDWTSLTSTGHGLVVLIEPANPETGVDEQLLVVPLPSPLRIGYGQLQD
jgi:hypothetical protein